MLANIAHPAKAETAHSPDLGDSRPVIFGLELLRSAAVGQKFKVVVAERDKDLIIGVGERTGPNSRQHWQILESALKAGGHKPEDWLGPDHRPLSGILVRGQDIQRASDDRILCDGQSLLYGALGTERALEIQGIIQGQIVKELEPNVENLDNLTAPKIPKTI